MTQKLRLALYDAVKESDVTEIMHNLVAKAKQGDAQAVKTVFDYLLGAKTQQQINVTRVNLDSRLIRQQEEQDLEVDRTVKRIEAIEPQATRVHRLLAMVMEKPPDITQLTTMNEGDLERAERWAVDQAKCLRRLADGVPAAEVIFPERPEFLKKSSKRKVNQ